MLCNEARDLMDRREKQSFQPENSPEFETHLQQCEACREIYQGIIMTEQMTASWEEEAVPAWDRLAHHMPRQAPTPWWTIVVPLAACFVMAVLVLGRVEVVSDESGFQVRFGAPSIGEEQLKTALDQALAASQVQTQEDMKELLTAYDERTNENVQVLLTQFSDNVRKERNDDLKTMVAQWQEVRAGDIQWVQNKFQGVLVRQERTHKNLNKIARYVRRDK